MTICDMALSHYLEQHGDAPRGSLVAYMPVNIRTEEDGGDGNLVTLLQVKLASHHRRSVVLAGRSQPTPLPRRARCFPAPRVPPCSTTACSLRCSRCSRNC